MDSKWILLLLMPTFCFQVSLGVPDFYEGAVVEYSPATEGSAQKRLSENLKNYDNIMRLASDKGVDIIVFPENGLTESVFSVVPDPIDLVVPCSQNQDSIVKNLSCIAKEHRMYVLVNLPEERFVVNSKGENQKFRYNTNVVFDRKGTVVARYAKFHLFDEFGFNRPEEPEWSFFETDFGVTFGTFTCFDILFEEPARRLISQHGVRNFLFPTRWFSELPFLTALQVQRGWAETHDVNLLASGYNRPKKGSTGSGIFVGKYGSFVHYMGKDEQTILLLSEIPTWQNKSISQPRAMKKIHLGDNLKISSAKKSIEGDGSKKSKETDFHLLSDQIELFNSTLIETGSDREMEVCSHDNFCCKFKVRLNRSHEGETNYNYRAVALNGVRKFGLSTTGGVQVCGVVFCHGPQISDCTERRTDLVGIFDFAKLEIEGLFKLENSIQIPSTLEVNHDGELDTLRVEEYQFRARESDGKKLVTLKLDFPTNNLMTFAIWGRDFSMDGVKPSLPGSDASHPISIPLLMMASLVLVLFRN